MKRMLAAVLAGVAVVLGAPVRAEAAAVPVYVDVNVAGAHLSWARMSLLWIDQYTTTQVVFGECVVGRRCVRINPGRLYNCDLPSKANGCAETGYSITDPTTRICTITIDTRPIPKPRGVDYFGRLYKHEAGHCYGLPHSGMNNLMYAPLYWNGKLVTSTFFPSQIAAIKPY